MPASTLAFGLQLIQNFKIRLKWQNLKNWIKLKQLKTI